MALNLTKEQREELEAALSAAEPFSAKDEEVMTLDAPIDMKRWKATMAKKFLEQDDREKRQAARRQGP